MHKTLKESCKIAIRFSEVDSLAIVWHGHYIKYFEDAREVFGLKYGLGYLDVYNKGFVTPLININCDFKRPLRYGDKAIVEAKFKNTPAAKIVFDYTIVNAETLELIATGTSTQAFLNRETFELNMTLPDFFIAWKKQMGLEV